VICITFGAKHASVKLPFETVTPSKAIENGLADGPEDGLDEESSRGAFVFAALCFGWVAGI
jgi:hypothetical protein